ncbi:hypothetical protein RJ639_009356 [Escallonia herrerae]|uniref:Cytochrome P450 n=1 Tax=Escallonia herrerae TaxID=1293975 RepID=A0AA89AT61_9ASTE|nr:hypothetical protein RJ639_009356 [Escallonia herrerae]
MAGSYPYLLLPLLLSITLSIVVFVRKKNLRCSKLPPGEVGWPVVGETFEFKRVSQSANPESFIHDRMKKHSPKVFRTSLFGENMAVFCGASGNKFLFTNEYKLKALNYPPSSLVRNPTKEELTKKRKILQEILKPEALRSYVPLMDSMARAHLETEWAQREEINVFPLLKKYTFALACRIFMGIDNPDHITRFSNPFAVLKAGLMSFPINIPGTTMNRSIKAGKIICDELIAIIKQRKHELSTKTTGSSVNRDLLSCMLLATDEDGKFMTEMEICNQILGSLIASHHTTSTVNSFIVKYLAELPDVYREVNVYALKRDSDSPETVDVSKGEECLLMQGFPSNFIAKDTSEPKACKLQNKDPVYHVISMKPPHGHIPNTAQKSWQLPQGPPLSCTLFAPLKKRIGCLNSPLS